jgi:tetratricopeptide (TPR) repeat protein
METKGIVQTIEEAFSARDMTAVRRNLSLLITKGRRNLKAKVSAAEFLLRLPDPARAFRLLCDEDHLDHEGRLVLANAANFLGASKYGLRILDSIPESVRRRRRIETGQILSTTYHDVEALDYFENAGSPIRPKPLNDPAGPSALMLRCYPLLELAKYEDVLAISDYFLTQNNSPGRKAFALIFAAWACAESNQPKKALAYLTKFEGLPGQGDTWPHTLYEHAAMICYARQGNYKKASLHVERAWKRSFQPGLQPEATWLQVLYWKGWISLAQSKRFPIEWARLCAYPTATNAYEKRISEVTAIPDVIFLNERRMLRHPKPLHFDLAGDSVISEGKPSLGLSTPERLLALLVAAGPIGIPMFRLFDTLWPEEPLSLRTHLKRLEGAVHVLRNQDCRVTWNSNHLWVSAGASIQRRVRSHSGNSFLELYSEFTRKDVERFFHASSRTAKRICGKWLQDRFIEVEGKGRATAYRVIKKKSQ